MNKRGFTLVEMMIVVAIIAILVGIALPNIMGSRRTANERAAMAELRTIGVALESYMVSRGVYPSSTTNAFDTLAQNGFLPNYYKNAGRNILRSHYTVSFANASTTDYTVTATPESGRHGAFIYRILTGGQLQRCNSEVAINATNPSCSGGWIDVQ